MTHRGQTLPHSLEAEEHLLSCCLLDGPDVVPRCIEARIRPGSFYDPKHGIIYEKLVELFNRKAPIDVSVVAEELKTSRQLDQIGGYAFLAQVSSRIPTTAQAGYFIEKVREQALLREIIRTATSAVEDSYNFSGDIEQFAADQRARFEGLAQYSKTARPAFTILRPSELLQFPEPTDSAILTLEDGSIAWRDGELLLILGPGGVGKSRLSVQLAVCQIIGAGILGLPLPRPAKRWLFIGNENSVSRWKADLGRTLAALSPSDQSAIESHLLVHALAEDGDFDLALDDQQALRRWRVTAEQFAPDIVVVDPWEAIIPGGDCNDAAATREGVRLLRSIFRPFNARFTPVVVHHAREGGEAAKKAVGFDAGSFAKGSKTLRSIARFAINVAPGDANDGARIVVACGKSNNSARFTTRSAVLNPCTGFYELDPMFDVERWVDDIDGKRRQSSLAIVDVVAAVREIARTPGDEVTTSQVVDNLKDSGAPLRTIQRYLAAATDAGYLRVGKKRGLWRLGAKPLAA